MILRVKAYFILLSTIPYVIISYKKDMHTRRMVRKEMMQVSTFPQLIFMPLILFQKKNLYGTLFYEIKCDLVACLKLFYTKEHMKFGH
jgi:hypothetical protein